MAPILGIWASQNYSRYSITGSYESIATVTVGSGGSSYIEFTSIPATYSHLQIRIISRDSRASQTLNNIEFIVNSDTGNNYAGHYLLGDGASAAAGVDGGSTPQANVSLGISSSASATASVFGTTVVDILDYANTNKYKTFRSLMGIDNNGSGSIRLRSGLWMSTSAITAIKMTPSTSGSFQQYSSFALYGIASA
jgi:hypothetical protein